MHFRELRPNGKAAPRLPARGAALPVDCTTLGIRGRGRDLHRGPGEGRWSPSGGAGGSAEEGVLALKEAQQPAIRGGLLDDLLDLQGKGVGKRQGSRLPRTAEGHLCSSPLLPSRQRLAKRATFLSLAPPRASLSPQPAGLALLGHLPSWSFAGPDSQGVGLCPWLLVYTGFFIGNLTSPVPQLRLPLNSTH